MTGQDIVTAVKSEAGFDKPDSVVFAWVVQRAKVMVARAKWRLSSVSLGETVADQTVYAVPENVVDLELLTVGGGAPFGRISVREMFELKAGTRGLVGTGGVFSPTYGSDASGEVEIYPAPDEDGLDVSAVGAVQLPDFGLDETPDIPEDLHEYLVDGAIAVGLARVDERLQEADRFEARFDAGVQELARRKNSRIGSGPVRIRVSSGYAG